MNVDGVDTAAAATDVLATGRSESEMARIGATAASTDGPHDPALALLLARNASLLVKLDAMTRMRDGGSPPSAAESALAVEIEANIARMVGAVPPSVLLAHTAGDGMQRARVPLKTFVDTSRGMGLLKLPCDLPPNESTEEGAGDRLDNQTFPSTATAATEETGAAREAGAGEWAGRVGPRAGATQPHEPRAMDGTPFTMNPLTGRLHYAGAFENIPKGEHRITLFSPAPGAPPGFQWDKVEGLGDVDQNSVKFFTRADIISHDPLDNGLVFRFDLYSVGHGISFNIGTGTDGTPLLSYSTLCALYEMPDGGKWAEHVDYFDLDDLQQHGRELGRRDWRRAVVLPDHDEAKELLRLSGRKHTRLSKCEYESWIYTRMEFADHERRGELVGKEAFFWRVEFDPKTLRRGAIHK